MEQPVVQWTPSIAPSGLAIYRGDKFPQWDGDAFTGALAHRHLRRIDLDDQGRAVGEQRLLTDLNERIRDVRVSPDGYIYVTTDSAKGDKTGGRVLRLEPAP
jgi:glucose/arabinose dehydrogenase